ncbi:EI24 domain-containing protein [Amnibacterium kyonggiense]|uniref:CysZ protein n=1 Tax=Amnibacterium kyonggiense TaxID=595671 RepID=A0A4R7FL08_9MICO|nr:EI24 domain-containing protein [Amnibacterium kyonggiense]TDS77063.1 CysZ protein [Amnibacterium kyonggiense]
MRDLLRGVGDLGRGFRLWGSSPRLMLLGAVPALVVGAVWLGLLVALLTSLDGVAASLTAFADDWDEPFRGTVRLAAGVAVLVLAVVVGALSFTAVVLTVGDPFYERISRAAEERLGNAPEERDEPLVRGVLRAARDGLVLLLASVVIGLVSFLLGLIPLVGAIIGGVFGAVAGGWFLAVELTGTPFDARGFRLRERRRVLARSRPRVLGFGIVTWVLFLVPFGAVVVMPAAVAGAAVLSRAALAADRHATGSERAAGPS